MIWALAFGRLYSITVLVNLVMLQHTRVGDNNDGIHTDGDLDNSVALRDGICMSFKVPPLFLAVSAG